MEQTEGYLGIDISKGYGDFILLDESERTLEASFRLDDNLSGHHQLEQLLHKWLDQYDLSCIKCGVESTGGYENNWYGVLKECSGLLPVEVARINPAGIKFHSQADLSRSITDTLSARLIASYMIKYPSKVAYRQVKVSNYKSLRSQYKLIRMLKKQISQSGNQLEKMVYSASPELLQWCRSGCSNWLLEVLSKYPVANKLARARLTSLTNIKGINHTKATKLKKAAKQSVGKIQNRYAANLISSLAQKILADRQMLDDQTKHLIKNCSKANPQLMQYLTSITGIADYSASCLLIEIEDIERFESASKLASFAGVHPVYKQSGDGNWGHHMSKKGRPAIRETLFNIARTAARHDPHIKKIYQHHRKQGKEYYEAIGVIMHKMLRIIYGVWSNQTYYDPAIDKQHIKRSKPKRAVKPKKPDNKFRRFQKVSLEAPVSRKNFKKRKTLIKPHSVDLNTKCEVKDKRQ